MIFIFLRHIFVMLAAFAFSFYLVPVLAETARKRAFLDIPDGKIKQHKKATPYLGGLAIYLSFITILALFYPFANNDLWLILGTTLLLFVGLIDDLNTLKPMQKFGGQILAVLCFLKGGFALKTHFFSKILNLASSGFWILAVVNAFNLVDVMDGLATILAIIAAASFFVIAIILKNYILSLLLATFLGALIGFFFHNKPPAKIYLGDAGSLFIGGFLATVPLLFPWSSIIYKKVTIPSFIVGNYFFEVILIALIPILLVGIPLLEVTSLIVIRMYHKIPFYTGSPHHFSFYLRKKGWGVRKILWFTGVKASILSVLAIMVLFGVLPFWILIGFLLLFSLIWFKCVFK